MEAIVADVAQEEYCMSQVSRRRFVGSAAAGVAMAAGVSAASAGAAPQSAATHRVAAQDGPTEIVFYHIWGTPPGGEASDTKHPSEQLIDAFNAQSTDVKVVSQTPSGDYF
jgi:ABC-type glycerol-3-phosphate transport system substrate-binding protein